MNSMHSFSLVGMQYLYFSRMPAYVPLGTTANKQGRIAGGNVAGGHDTFKGILGSMVTKVFELFIAATGLSKEQAAGEGYDAISVSITKADV